MLVIVAGLAAGLSAVTAWWVWRGHDVPSEWTLATRPPRIRPDYSRTVIPPNIAPLNFVVEEPGTAYYVRVAGAEGPSLAVRSGDGRVQIPPGPWRALLAQNRGKPLSVETYVGDPDHGWQRFEAIQWNVAEEEIDPYLVYRVLDAVYDVYKYLGIYQRNLESFDESPLLFNSVFNRGCVNCHSFLNNRPATFLLHSRPGLDESIAAGPILVREGKAARVKTRTEARPFAPHVTSLHPSGDLAAFSVNWFGQFMRGTGTETREVVDLDSDLAIVDFRTGDVSTSPGIADPDRLETFPSWSPDGKHLFFSSAPRLWKKTAFAPLKDYKQVKYDLMRIPYDVAAGTWGKPELLLAAGTTGKSILQPRASPDGRYLLFCMCDHGPFPAFQEDSDLYLMDLANRSYRRLERANSPRSESWHSWSSNSRWIAFSSRRDNGLVARPYLFYLDRSGQDHKAFLLPQHDPRFYDTSLNTYNVPELITGPITVPEKVLLDALRTPAPDAEIQPPRWSGLDESPQ
jgi:hypothetical protein